MNLINEMRLPTWTQALWLLRIWISNLTQSWEGAPHINRLPQNRERERERRRFHNVISASKVMQRTSCVLPSINCMLITAEPVCEHCRTAIKSGIFSCKLQIYLLEPFSQHHNLYMLNYEAFHCSDCMQKILPVTAATPFSPPGDSEMRAAYIIQCTKIFLHFLQPSLQPVMGY